MTKYICEGAAEYIVMQLCNFLSKYLLTLISEKEILLTKLETQK